MNTPERVGQITVERWRAVVGFEDYYEVSDYGQVRSLDRYVKHGKGRTFVRGRTIQPSADEHGRLGLTLCADGHQLRRRVHVLVLEAFTGPRRRGMIGCHNNGMREGVDA